MARQNRDRHVWGHTNPIYMETANDQMIMTGDLCYMLTNSLYPLSYAAGQDFRWVRDFIGVAMQYAIDQDPDEVRVATDGVFEFDCLPDTFIIGEGVYQWANPQFVYGRDDRSSVNGIIGRVWKRYASNTTKVLVKIDTSPMFPHAST